MAKSTISYSSVLAAPMAPGVDHAAERQRWRFVILGAALITLACLVLVRLISVQFFSDQLPLYKSGNDRQFAARGIIADRNGMLLAADHLVYQVTASPRQLDTDAARLAVAQQLYRYAQIPIETTLAKLTTAAEENWVKLADSVPISAGLELRALVESANDIEELSPFLHVQVEEKPERYYPQTGLASHILGFVNPARDSLYGLERYYDRYLLNEGIGGIASTRQVPLEMVAPQLMPMVPSKAGNDLVLSLDLGVQWILEDELLAGVQKYRAQGGTIVVMEPKTGAILGMASWPDFDPNHYTDSPVEAFLDPAISQQYEPGSIFKIITMGGALDAELIEPETKFNDYGEFVIGQRTIYNSDLASHGMISVQDALALSLNVVTAQVAELMGDELFYQYLRRFGFGVPSEVDLAGEVSGIVKSPGNELWSHSDLGTNSFGQGIAVTPLQFTNAAAAIANGGKLMRPYIVKARIVNGQAYETEPTVVREVMSAEAAKKLLKMMVYTVNFSNIDARVAGYSIAGKSGTAQVPGPEGYYADQINTSFIGIAPADNPQLVILVKLDRPDYQLTQWADQNAVPMFARVARRLFLHLNIPPDGVR